MAITYEASFHFKKNELVLTRLMPDASSDTVKVNPEEISQIEKLCKDFQWHQSAEISKQIGERLFNLLNGDRQTLARALKEADDHGESLQLLIKTEKMSDLPFELLYHSKFLVSSQIHLIRHVSDYGCKRESKPEGRPLRVLFMACSPEGLSPVLDFEKEEEKVYEITENLPVDIDVEDSGSLDGLRSLLETNEYDVIHISGHADIGQEGSFFWMEDEIGAPVKVTPSELYNVLKLNLPRLLFLSGCLTGKAPFASSSFAQQLVLKHSSTVLGWGLPVSDQGATIAATEIYRELSRGKSISDAVFSARQKLYESCLPDWSLLRLFSDGTPLTIPLVEGGQEMMPKKETCSIDI